MSLDSKKYIIPKMTAFLLQYHWQIHHWHSDLIYCYDSRTSAKLNKEMALYLPTSLYFGFENTIKLFLGTVLDGRACFAGHKSCFKFSLKPNLKLWLWLEFIFQNKKFQNDRKMKIMFKTYRVWKRISPKTCTTALFEITKRML